ncbi:MAG: hypothetical protein V1774_02565 [Candidatus Eisenbacteria bacterium]
MKNAGGSGAGRGEGQARGRDKGKEVRKWGPGGSRGRVALVAAVVGVALIVLFVIIPRGRNTPVEPPARSTVASSTSPINTTDPTSGKRVVAGIYSVYKGLTIGHCCEISKREWEVLSVERKEAYLLQLRK